MSRSARFLGSAKLIAACTLASRITGLARDVIINRAFGQNWVQDAFQYGFLIPNLFRRLFGEGALSAIFVPVFVETLDRHDRDRAWVLLGRVTGLMVLVLVVLTVLLEAGVLLVGHFYPAGPMRALQVELTAIMLPFMIGICVLALFSSILNCLQHFAAPALMPIVLNVMLVVGVLVVGPALGDALEDQVVGLGYSVLAAGAIQLVIIIWVMKRRGVRCRPSLSRGDPDVRRMVRLFVPVLLGQGVLLFSVFFDAQICTFLTRGPQSAESFSIFGRDVAYPLTEGALSAITNAQRLYQFPLGVLAISLATAVFPRLSLYASRRDYPNLRQTLGQSVRVALFEGVPCAILLVVLAHPIVTLLFEYGRYDAADSVRAAHVLRWYAVGVPAFCCQHLLLRAFYSLKDTKTPMWISVALVAVNLGLSLALVFQPAIREAAFGISTSVTATIHCVVSVWLLRRRMQGYIGGRAIALSAVRILIAGAGVWFVADALRTWTAAVDLAAWGRIGGRAARVFIPMAGAGAVFVIATMVLRSGELGWLLGRSRPAKGPS
jgi:putative peptidoglycan lipid II flippase